MAIHNERITNPAKQQVLVTRIFEAPVDLVFSMWTNPEHHKRWWGPKNNTNLVCEMDVRPGGPIIIIMQTGDGRTIPVTGIFNEVSPPNRLVFTTMENDGHGNTLMEVSHTVTLTEENGKTRLIMTIVVLQSSPGFVTSCQGMELGWNQSFDRLAEQMILGTN
ncbi:MAG TPA: SRPBCC domain-containing protein [Puia sp.]|nr:SRPBCC domain-containing protein [Puia sp.]